jgi:hypothetical protein
VHINADSSALVRVAEGVNLGKDDHLEGALFGGLVTSTGTHGVLKYLKYCRVSTTTCRSILINHNVLYSCIYQARVELHLLMALSMNWESR